MADRPSRRVYCPPNVSSSEVDCLQFLSTSPRTHTCTVNSLRRVIGTSSA